MAWLRHAMANTNNVTIEIIKMAKKQTEDFKIGQDLRVVKQINDDIAIHHEPIGYDLYCQNWEALSQLVAKSFANGLGGSPLAGNTMLFSLNDIASNGLSNIYHLGTITRSEIESNKELENNTSFKRLWSFVNELKRRTNVITVNNGHYGHVPFLECVDNGTITQQEQDKVLSLVLFFTALSYAEIPPPSNVLNLLDSQAVSLDCMGYIKHLQTLTTKESTTDKA